MEKPHSPLSNIVELRMYQLTEGSGDRFMAFFEEHFLESQEQAGMQVWGQYRDLNNENAFVWFRGFQNMDQRKKSLEDFYLTGPIWETYKDEANGMMVDSDNVLLLKPWGNNGFKGNARRPRLVFGLEQPSSTKPEFVSVSIFRILDPGQKKFPQWFTEKAVRFYEKNGAKSVGFFVSEPSKNSYPLLPVTQDPALAVWVAVYPNRETFLKTEKLFQENKLRQEMEKFLEDREVLELVPGYRSRQFISSGDEQ